MIIPRFILTADDYGPVDFINNGIIHHVEKGTINSVQVLSNIDQTLLNENMDLLWKAVPQEKTVDIGIHLTLSSGLPLIKERDGMNTPTIWGDFVNWKKYINRKGKKVKNYVFSKYSDFYLEYELQDNESRTKIEHTIIQEFRAQKAQLEIALSIVAQNNPDKPNALKLTSVSNHFDLFTLSDKFFTLYRDVAGPNLAIRSPRRIPFKKSKAYVNGLGVLGVGTRKQRATAKINMKLFDKYQYSKPVTIKTSGYIDIGLYAALGGMSETPVFTGFDSRYKKLEIIIDRSRNIKVWKDYPVDDRIVEIVFHLGATPIRNPNFSRRDEQGYVGINYKYFDNRLIETRVLNLMSQEKEFKDVVLNNLTSWGDCPIIKFTL